MCFFKNQKDNEEFFIVGYWFISPTIELLKEIGDLLMSNSMIFLANSSFYLNLWILIPY